MRHPIKVVFAVMLILFGTASCAQKEFVEKQSKALSVSVYATKDSFDAGRFDLTTAYLDDVVKIVTPPNITDRIKIQSVVVNNQRKLIVPPKFKGQTVLIVGSDEYNSLLKTRDFAQQLQVDNTNLQKQAEEVSKQLDDQKKVTNDMIIQINSDKTLIEQQKHTIFMQRLLISGIVLSVGVLKFTKIL